MNYRTRLKQLITATLILWLLTGILIGFLTYFSVALVPWIVILVAFVLSAVFSILTLNQSQGEVSRVNKEHSRTKRTVQEQQLKIDRFEYDAKKSGEMRRIVLNATQEKDHSLKNMAEALDHAMDEVFQITEHAPDDAMAQIQTRVSSLKRYATDMQFLAMLELKSELPEYIELDFLKELGGLIENWTAFGKDRRVKVKLDNPEEQITIYSDLQWIANLLSRIALALIRLNEKTQLHTRLISYLDAELGDALRIEFSIKGWLFSDEQLKRLLTEYVSVINDGQEIGPGLSFVVARRMAQLLNGYLEVENGAEGLEVLIVLPRNPAFAEEEEEVAAF